MQQHKAFLGPPFIQFKLRFNQRREALSVKELEAGISKGVSPSIWRGLQPRSGGGKAPSKFGSLRKQETKAFSSGIDSRFLGANFISTPKKMKTPQNLKATSRDKNSETISLVSSPKLKSPIKVQWAQTLAKQGFEHITPCEATTFFEALLGREGFLPLLDIPPVPHPWGNVISIRSVASPPSPLNGASLRSSPSGKMSIATRGYRSRIGGFFAFRVKDLPSSGGSASSGLSCFLSSSEINCLKGSVKLSFGQVLGFHILETKGVIQ
eukprot:TRINITY_DN37064_c0_g1_i1.p1 TRINITY_DN37064_c0_g1~~TRINITY_DN37064_c0_g1_i1.p1  ORF type:complete len:267 (-),score=22.52 TRINITY_DN37064_c0_g1_i1:332-1132(-)